MMLFVRLLPLLLLAALVGGIVYVYRAANSTPEARLKMHFIRTRRAILEQLDGSPHRAEAGQLLEQCDGYLKRLFAARRQWASLDELSRAAAELSPLKPDVKAKIDAFEEQLNAQLSGLIDQLTEIAARTPLDQDGAVGALRDLSTDLQLHEEALNEVEVEVHRRGPAREASGRDQRQP